MGRKHTDTSHVPNDVRTRRGGWVLAWVVAMVFVVTAGSFGASAVTPPALAATDVGSRDFSFAAPGVGTPTGEKPQSKLWFNDGSWWGVLFDRSAEEYRIYRYERASNSWTNTGTLVDERNNSKADVLWDGSHLSVVSAGPGPSTAADNGRFLRYSYDPATRSYALDAGFPTTVSAGGTEAMVLDKDTTGKFWTTFTKGGKVYVNRSLDATGQTWGAPFVLPVPGADNLKADDISSVIRFGGKIGVLWSNQNTGAVYFATHADGAPDNAWQGQVVAQGPLVADDHMNLKLESDAGRVFAVVKTSLGDNPNADPNDPQTVLLVRGTDGTWSQHVVGTVADGHTRPIVLIDQQNSDLYVFATAPTGGGTIYYKKTPLSNISFAPGRGTPFIRSASDPQVDNATSTKQNLDSATDLLVLASDSDVSDFYLHNTIDLGATAPEPPADATAPTVQPQEQNLVASSTLGTSAVPVNLSWSAADASGVSGYELQQSVNDGAYAGVKLPTATATSKSLSLPPGNAYQYRVRATDGAGNTSDWSYGPRFVVDARQETDAAISYGGAWTPQGVTSAYGGALQYATAAGAKATFGFTGLDVAWVAPKGPDRGKAEVWVDGVKVKTVDLYASAAQPRKAVYTQSWGVPGSHTLEVRVLGTKRASSSGTRADVDAFVALR